ncbi:MAG: patatin-like phospholipase family protein, partial [Bacteroidota bacterium]
MKTTRFLYHFALVSFFCFSTINAQAQSPATSNPKLGITLSGGGAKGLAHIGVLKVLEAEGIFPDYMSGTSMGSIVGGLYATGYTPADLEQLATTTNWNNYFTDSYARNFLPIDRRNKADRYQLSFALEDGKLKLPQGLIGGKKILTLLTGVTAGVHRIHSFDNYYIPFRAVATNLENGEGYVFKEGPLRKAIRASMSIPSAFDPLWHDDHVLVDGMIARNLPIEDVVEMGSEVVIGVDVGAPLYYKEELNSVLKVQEQVGSFIIVDANEKQRAMASMLIDPDLTGLTALSYDQADTMIARGEAAARAALSHIKHYLDSIGWKKTIIPERPKLRRDSFLINTVTYLASDSATQKTLYQLLNFKLPRLITIDDITQKISILYASGFFSYIDYEFALADGGGYELRIEAERTPNVHLRGSVNYDIDFNAGLLLNLSARNQLGYGSLLSADLRISEYPGVWLDYSINTRSTPSFGIQLYANGQIIPGKTYSEGELIDEYTFHHYSAGLALQTNISRQWHFKAGIGGERFSENPRFFSVTDLDARAQRWLVSAQLIRDTYDRTYFSTDGSLSQLWVEYNLNGQLEEAVAEGDQHAMDGFITFGGQVHKAFPIGNKVWLDASAGAGHADYQKDHFLQRFYLGRAIPENRRFYEVYGLNMAELSV